MNYNILNKITNYYYKNIHEQLVNKLNYEYHNYFNYIEYSYNKAFHKLPYEYISSNKQQQFNPYPQYFVHRRLFNYRNLQNIHLPLSRNDLYYFKIIYNITIINNKIIHKKTKYKIHKNY